ncbi:dockerin type I repeat protein [Anaerobacterium chartisolvens]|uniref:Dockerin type I repeat protein n=1 Tax=Anaerobacterium chartisolvens TaxID=1297424 RepID=A0A369AZH8_9FIRM|nr:carbohydrate-binding protein [Anaerobacterium chartisolvens]RCX14840.1 dockerin type I repeat protein [Anaerobacterium chartisolvens]
MKKGSAIFIGLVMLMVFQMTASAASFMDYFKPMPIIEALSSSCWGAPEVGPRDQSNGLEDKTMSRYCYWDGGIIKGPDGTYHMFASRWNQSAGHNGWFGSVAVHATSSNLYGPYTDKGLCWPNDQGGKGHNVVPFQLKDGRYAILVSETRRPADIFVSNSLDGPWSKLGSVSIAQNSYSSLYTASNVYIMLRPDGRYGLIERDAVIGISDNVLGPYVIQGTNIYAKTPGCPTVNMEDPVMWYSGGLYHIVANKWDTRKAYHLTSEDGISNWKLDSGYAYDPTANFLRYTDGTVNRWNKLERPNVYMEDGHVVAMLLSAIDVAKDKDLGNDRHGSKVIVVPFDGAALDGGITTPPDRRSAFTKIEAESYNNQSGVQTETCTEGGLDVGYIENGDYTVYKNIDFGNGALAFQARAATSTQGGNIEIRLDSINGPLVGTCPVGTTGGFQNWVDVSCNISGASGKHDLYLKFTGGSGYLFNLNWFQFTQSAFSRIEAESYSGLSSSSIQIADTPDGGKSLAYVENGNYAIYGKVDFGSGASSFKAKVAAAGTTSIDVRLGSSTGTLIGTLPVASTGGWNEYQDQSCAIDKVTGIKDVYLVFKGSVNLDCFSFAEKDGPGTVTLGDLNSDGKIDSVDFLLMKKHILEMEVLSDPACADLDGNGAVNTVDMLLLKQYLLGIITGF